MSNILNEGLPKKTAKEMIRDVRKNFKAPDVQDKFFPEEKLKKYQNNFDLFAGVKFPEKKGKGIQQQEEKQEPIVNQYIQFQPLKDLLVSINVIYNQDELQELYNQFEEENQQNYETGINFEQFQMLIYKKIRDDDKEAQLVEAFQIIEENAQFQGQQGTIDCEKFKDLLMSKGLKWSEDLVDELLKTADPKSDGKFQFEDFIKKLIK